MVVGWRRADQTLRGKGEMARQLWAKMAIALVTISALASCTTPPATPQGMSATVAPAAKPNWVVRRAIAIGSITDVSGHSAVTAASFRQALEQSLAKAGYLAMRPKPRYRLGAALQQFDEPPFTLTGNVGVTVTVLYRLTGPGTNAQYSITDSGAATFDEATAFGKRVQLASERALRANIEALLDKLQKF